MIVISLQLPLLAYLTQLIMIVVSWPKPRNRVRTLAQQIYILNMKQNIINIFEEKSEENMIDWPVILV